MENLTRELGLFEALTIGIGTMICAGIFVLPGISAYRAGPGAILSFAICAFVSIFIALCMSELATGLPQAGGGYLYVTRAFGPFIGTIIGCTLWLSLCFAAAFYMMGFGEYIYSFMPFISAKTWAIIMSLILISINYRGTKESAWLQNAIVSLLVIILIGFSLRGLFSVSFENYSPFVPYGWSSIFSVSSLLFVTFCGFAEITAVGEEIKDPERNIPISLIGSVAIVTFIYLFVMSVLVGLRRYDQLNSTTIVIELSRNMMGGFGAFIIIAGGIFATVSSANASIMSASRINFAMGRDKLIPDWLNKVHPRFMTPYRSIINTGILILLMLFASKLELLAEVAGFLSLILYALVCLACVIMRRADVEWYKPSFRVPLGDVLSTVGFISCFFVMRYMQPIVLVVGFASILFSFIWFYFYVRKNTKLEGVSRVLFIQRVLTPMVKIGQEIISEQKQKQPGYATKCKILVPLANPASEHYLTNIAVSLCNQDHGQIDLLHVMAIPEQLVIDQGRNYLQKIKEKRELELEGTIEKMPQNRINMAQHVIIGHNISSSIMATIETGDYDFVLFGWAGRITKSNLSHKIVYLISKHVNTHVLVLDYKKFDNIKRILVPFGSGPHSRLCLQLADRIAQAQGSELTVVQAVLPGMNLALVEQKRINLERFLQKKGIKAKPKIIVRDSIVEAIVGESENYDIIVIGASNDWIFKQRLFGTITDEVANRAACSVLMVRSSGGGHAAET